jgi:small subunit ribosomal protein S7
MSKPTSAVIQKSNEEKFINHLMKNGKKSVARKIYADALKEIKKAGHMNPAVVVQTAIENASPNIMIKSKRIG